jgi:hypothetical protein
MMIKWKLKLFSCLKSSNKCVVSFCSGKHNHKPQVRAKYEPAGHCPLPAGLQRILITTKCHTYCLACELVVSTTHFYVGTHSIDLLYMFLKCNTSFLSLVVAGRLFIHHFVAHFIHSFHFIHLCQMQMGQYANRILYQ